MLRTAIARMSSVFSPLLIRRAKDLVIQGSVLSVRLSDGLLKARVKGESNQIFDIFFDLKQWPDTPTKCSCTTKSNCEHAAAALIALQTKQSHKTPDGSNTASKPFIQESILDAEDVEWYSDVGAPGNQFFSYQLGILIDGERVSLLPVVLELVERWDAKSLENLSDNLEVKLPV